MEDIFKVILYCLYMLLFGFYSKLHCFLCDFIIIMILVVIIHIINMIVIIIIIIIIIIAFGDGASFFNAPVFFEY